MKYFVVGLIAFLFGLSATYGLTRLQSESPAIVEEVPGCYRGDYIDDQVCEPRIISKAEYANLRLRLEEYIALEKENGRVAEVGIFFRDLEDGPTLGINEYAEFSAASLLKVPALVAYLELADRNPEVLSVKLRVDPSINVENFYKQHYQPLDRIVPGKEYLVSDLLWRSIDQSDNLAHSMLTTYLQTGSTGDVYVDTLRELGLVPANVGLEFVLSVKRYASIFRTLYTTTYLSPEKSDEALRILSETDFTYGLRAGVPSDVVVAHKFGERTFSDPINVLKNVNQLHDCGIVYFPENPYALCIMTRGDDFSELEDVVSTISRLFYEEVERRQVSL